jgi:type III secretory pathway component EscV
MNENEQYVYGKTVDDLTVEELIEYDNNNVHILLVRNKVPDEVREVAKGTFVFIYDGLDDEKIQQVLSMLRNTKGDVNNET